MQQRTVQIWVQDQKVDLFQDEKITMSLSTQNFKDLKKVFTDFTQSFTLPATPNNNKIFSYWYENALNTGYNANVRVAANIEINHTPFREGKLQLEEAVVKEGQIDHYKVTFYGNLKTLFDLIGDDKLRDLDYSTITFILSGANVEDRIDGTTVDNVAFPLISSEKVWTYGDDGTNDIDGTSSISFDELFPALYLDKIFSIIESQYGVTFTGAFTGTGRWTAAYVWWKNRELSTTFTTMEHRLEFGEGTGNQIYSEDTEVLNTMEVGDEDKIILNSSNLFQSQGASGEVYDTSLLTEPANFTHWGLAEHHLKLDWTKDNGSTAYLDVFVNGSHYNTINISGTSGITNLYFVSQNHVDSAEGQTIEIYSRDQQQTTYSGVSLLYTQKQYYFVSTTGGAQEYIQQANYNVEGWTSNSEFDWNTTAPDIKVRDFLTGVFQMFNLTCYATSSTTFQMEPLGDFYAGGDEIDITEYVDEDTIKYKRPKLHKEIAFTYQKSKSFLNEAYLEANSKPYGDLTQEFPYDGPKYEVKLPFEHLLFQQFSGTDIKVAYSLTKAPDYKPYIPKPVILFRQADFDITGASFFHHDGSSANEITNYVPFGNEYTETSGTYSSNFGQEISVENLLPIQSSLYWVYYRPYLENLFNIKQRIVQVKAMLPQKILNYMTLDDALIIRDKKYRINQAKLDLTGGPVDLELFQDFVSDPINLGTSPPGGPLGPVLEPLTPAGGTIEIPIRPVKPFNPLGGGGGDVDISAVNEGSPFLTSGDFGTTVTSEKVMTITVAANSTGAYRCNTFDITYKRPDGTTMRVDYYEYCQESDSSRLLTEGNDNLITERLEKIAEE